MTISIITIVRNDRDGIGRTLRSVLEQSARDSIEYIVIDGASTDGTSDIIRHHAGSIDRYICEPDHGIYDAMNKGLDAATGDYVIFINSGDRLSGPGVIADITEAISLAPFTPTVVYGDYREFSGDSDAIGDPIPCRDASRIWYGPVASHQSTLYSLAHLRRHSLRYDTSYRIAADYKLTAQAILASPQTALRTSLCISDFNTDGVSSTNQGRGLAEANRVRREVMGWGRLRCAMLTCAAVSARYFKRFAGPLYRKLRQHV